MNIEISEDLKKLAKILPKPLYIVGGYIRNILLGLRCDDIDLCSELDVEQIEKLLKNSEFSVKIKSKSSTVTVNCSYASNQNKQFT